MFGSIFSRLACFNIAYITRRVGSRGLTLIILIFTGGAYFYGPTTFSGSYGASGLTGLTTRVRSITFTYGRVCVTLTNVRRNRRFNCVGVIWTGG